MKVFWKAVASVALTVACFGVIFGLIITLMHAPVFRENYPFPELTDAFAHLLLITMTALGALMVIVLNEMWKPRSLRAVEALPVLACFIAIMAVLVGDWEVLKYVLADSFMMVCMYIGVAEGIRELMLRFDRPASRLLTRLNWST